MEFIKQHKIIVSFLGVAVAAAVAGILIYWFWWKPRNDMSQERVGEPVVPLPRVPLPQGTRPVQGRIQRLPKAVPSEHFPTQGQAKHISAADAIRQVGQRTNQDNDDEEILDDFFESSNIPKETEYPSVRRQ